VTEERNAAKLLCQPRFEPVSRGIYQYCLPSPPPSVISIVANVTTTLYRVFIGLDGEMSDVVKWGNRNSFYFLRNLVVVPTSENLM
jgi:hypothetical protein